MEKEFGRLTVRYIVYDVAEVEKSRDGPDSIRVYRIFHVVDEWDFSDVQEKIA